MSVIAAMRPALTNKDSRVISALPDVKCTNCGIPVPLDQLSDHVCTKERPNPPQTSPSSLLKKSHDPKSDIVIAPIPSRTLSPSPSSFARASTSSRARSPSAAPSHLRPTNTLSFPAAEDRTRLPLVSPPVMGTPVLRTDSRASRLSTATVRSTSKVRQSSYSNSSKAESIRSPSPSVTVSDQKDIPHVVFPPLALPDTKAGGQGGMAGVGRRAFQAVAQAELMPVSGHFSQYLDVNSIYDRIGTPPLSTPRSSPSPRISDPRTPSPRIPSPFGMSTSIPRIGSPFPQDSPLSSRPPPRTQDSDGSDVLLPYDREGSPEFEKPPAPAPTSTLLPPPRKDSITFPSNRNRRSDTTGSSSSYTSPSHPDDDRTSVSSSSGPQKINRDTIVTSSIYSTASNDTRTPRYSKSMGALNRSAPRQLMDTLTEEDVSPTTSRVVDPSSVPIAESAKPPSSTEPLKIPSRSMTTPARTNAPTTRRKRTVRACIRCQKKIEDGRWVAVDQGDGGVLCEKDWKDMYLPKCRRCGLTIESHAVSSADGQLKGKYHRHCFNCSTCQKPFPDRSFYVFGGQPFCDYHYHQANNSLCCNSTCGKPIEGPCAEDHEGRRYHPNHLVCSEAGCEERLEDYYDVEGFKYCEKHYFESHRDGVQTDDIHVESRSSSPQGPGRVSVPGTPKKDESPSMLSTPRGTPDSRATKRRTRLIALDPARRI